MDGMQVTRLDGSRGTLEPGSIDALETELNGRLIRPGDPGYEDGRHVWNGMIDRRPALIARCQDAADVRAAVRFAGEHRLLLAVRGGGHNVAGFGTCDGGLVIDLSRMRDVHVDLDARTARVAGGATLADVDAATQEHGLAIPGGIVSTTGVAGLTLGGGQGWLRRTFGMTCDSLLSAEVVTADGQVVTASEAEHPELFWALRGGGGNFGVVTSFEFRTHPVGPTLAFAGPGYPLERAETVIAAMREFAAAAPDEVNVSATWWTIPAVPGFPEELHGRHVIILGAVHVGPPEEGERLLQPLREVDVPLLDLSASVPYVGLQQMFDPFFPARALRYYWKSMYLAELGDDAVRTVAESVRARPSESSMVGMWALGGALDRVDPAATATGARGAPFLLEILTSWDDPADDEVNVTWARDLFDAMKPFGTGKTNVNFPGFGDDTDFGRAAFGEQWSRLVEVKRRYDPKNLFRLNQNVDPEG
jgi:FAD/FMN-containing dehydrogenase